MKNATTPRRPGVKMTIRVYTVTRTGIVTPPRATVSVPYGYEPARESMNTAYPDCGCPEHRKAGAAR